MKEVKRVDQELIDLVTIFLRKHGCIDKKEKINIMKEMAKYPLIRMDNVIDKVGDELGDIILTVGNKAADDKTEKVYSVGKICLYKPFFRKSNYYYNIPLYNKDLKDKCKASILAVLHIDLDSKRGHILFKFNGIKNKTIEACSGILPIVVMEETSDYRDVSIDIDRSLIKSNSNFAYDASVVLLNHYVNAMGIGTSELSRIVSMMIGMVMMGLGDLHVNNYYPFETGVNRRGEGGEVIFLNRIPSNPSNKKAEREENEKTPHMRRGYWWTMRNERYKSHPHYQKENANYRQASWVGPGQFNWQGKTYKIILPKDDALTASE